MLRNAILPVPTADAGPSGKNGGSDGLDDLFAGGDDSIPDVFLAHFAAEDAEVAAAGTTQEAFETELATHDPERPGWHPRNAPPSDAAEIRRAIRNATPWRRSAQLRSAFRPTRRPTRARRRRVQSRRTRCTPTRGPDEGPSDPSDPPRPRRTLLIGGAG